MPQDVLPLGISCHSKLELIIFWSDNSNHKHFQYSATDYCIIKQFIVAIKKLKKNHK